LKTRLHLSKQAEVDLDDIWFYVAQDSLRHADHLITEIRDKCELLAVSPGLGRQRDELRRSLRSFPWGEYVIFYRFSTEGIEVVRILHGHRDMETIFRAEQKADLSHGDASLGLVLRGCSIEAVLEDWSLRFGTVSECRGQRDVVPPEPRPDGDGTDHSWEIRTAT
jgi:toxin ParE1/3/4